jgi:hypothetical protein
MSTVSRTRKRPPLREFSEWLHAAGYKLSTNHQYVTRVGSLLEDLPSYDHALVPEAVLAAAEARSASSRLGLSIAWNAYARFISSLGGPTLACVLPPTERSGRMNPLTGTPQRFPNDLPPRVQDCVGALLSGGERRWKRIVKAELLTSLTWSVAESVRLDAHFRVATDVGYPASEALTKTLTAWAQGGTGRRFNSNDAWIPALYGGTYPAAISTYQRAVKHAKGRPALGLLLLGRNPWGDTLDDALASSDVIEPEPG